MSGGTLAAAGNNPLNKRILSAPAGYFYGYGIVPIASCFFVCRKYLRHTKRPGLRSRPGWFSLQSRITYKKITMANGKSGRPKAKDPKTHRYNFKLNDEQELHFRRMLEEAGYRENISKFILARLFG